jgi:hypothetical protein
MNFVKAGAYILLANKFQPLETFSKDNPEQIKRLKMVLSCEKKKTKRFIPEDFSPKRSKTDPQNANNQF